MTEMEIATDVNGKRDGPETNQTTENLLIRNGKDNEKSGEPASESGQSGLDPVTGPAYSCEVKNGRLVCSCASEEVGLEMESVVLRGVIIETNVVKCEPVPYPPPEEENGHV